MFSSSTWTGDYANEIKDFCTFTQVSGDTPEAVCDLVESAAGHGLKSVIALRENPRSFHPIAEELSRRGLARHVLGWYPYDEPCLNGVELELMNNVGKMIKSRFPNHKILAVFGSEDIPAIPPEFDWVGVTPNYGEWLGSRHHKHRMDALKTAILPHQEFFFCMDGGQPGRSSVMKCLFRIITNWWYGRKARKMNLPGVWWWLWPSTSDERLDDPGIIGTRDMKLAKWYIKRLARKLSR
jgi:hypothetical protein